MNKKMARVVALLMGSYAMSIFAANSPATFAYCPQPNEIHKNPVNNNWTAQTKAGFWKSYHFSFATTITRFVGAQWNGANVGQLTCIYHSKQRFTMNGQETSQRTLPILLVFHTLARQPSGAKWKHVATGIVNCYGQKIKDCPFVVNMKPSVGNIYQEAEALKSNPPKQLEPPSY